MQNLEALFLVFMLAVLCAMYADDLYFYVMPLFPWIVLQAVINLCCDEIAYNNVQGITDMSLNVSQSFVVRIVKRFEHVCAPLTE